MSRVKILLFLILAFSLLSRGLFLASPADEYFDEVYHTFTARRMLHADPKAWEWWNTPPEGFAYEWTHPPLAKEMMVLGMLIFGESAFGWRAPGALIGVGCVFIVFLLAKTLFEDEEIGLLASAVFALEGLPLVMSRIGMNDIYLLFFALLSIYLFWKKKNFLSSLALGLAISAKWSAVWVVPILVVSHLVLRKKISTSYLWFLVIPPLVYIASYTPMFLTGHGFDIFVGVQKQMWWYHTRLTATHPFTSAWWSWPLLMRPIWLFTSSPRAGFISNIYAMGNPVIFWSGLAAIIFSAILSFVKRKKKLGLLFFCYLVFFVPWAVSPRIMFLYHYLPSLPFLAIALGYVLKRYSRFTLSIIIVSILAFLYFYPHWTGMEIPIYLDSSYYWFSSWH